ncbi:DUF975 family protein [Streptococcus iniae]|uniref:DUF975 family protein n=1 Tax=Streptococcus iniae TaxID=1346 RepID=UPI00217CCDB1|nr:DUF975 family protein [Streptococcus iniae]
MMKTRAELKREAKEALKGNWGWAIQITFLPMLLVVFINVMLNYFIDRSISTIGLDGELVLTSTGLFFSLILSIIYIIVLTGLEVNFENAFLNLIRGKKTSFTPAMSYAFTQRRFGKFFLTNLVMGIFVYLWLLLLVIPGIIKSLSYSQANYILIDQIENGDEVSVTGPITKSRAMMDGHKWEFFVLQLSFIGWSFLALFLTFGIGFIWLSPYIMATTAAYYDNLKAETSGEKRLLNVENPEESTADDYEELDFEEAKEEVVSDVPLMGQPEIKDATMK